MINNYKIIGIISLTFFLISCSKELKFNGDLKKFNVSIENKAYHTGDTVNFKFKGGNAHSIAFYSGEIGHDYDFREGRTVDISGQGMNVVFSSANPPVNNAQNNPISLLISTDFNGDYTSLSNIKSATWVDVTNQFNWSNNATFVSSGVKDFSSYVNQGETIYFAFKYESLPRAINGVDRQWQIQGFNLSSIDAQFNGAVINISGMPGAGFHIIDEFPNDAPSRSVLTDTRLTLYGPEIKRAGDAIYDINNPIFDPESSIFDPSSPDYRPGATPQVYVPFDPSSPFNDPETETWAISRGISLSQPIQLGKDLSTPLRANMFSDSLTTYSYVYKTPGTYKAYFVAGNFVGGSTTDFRQNVKGDEVIKEIVITIEP